MSVNNDSPWSVPGQFPSFNVCTLALITSNIGRIIYNFGVRRYPQWWQSESFQLSFAITIHLKATQPHWTTFCVFESLWHNGAYNRFFLCICMDHLSRHVNTETCFEVCCYGVELGATLVRIRAEYLDQWECSSLGGRKCGCCQFQS